MPDSSKPNPNQPPLTEWQEDLLRRLTKVEPGPYEVGDDQPPPIVAKLVAERDALAAELVAKDRIIERHVRWREKALRLLGTSPLTPEIKDFIDGSVTRIVKATASETHPECKAPTRQCGDTYWCNHENECLYPRWHPQSEPDGAQS